MGQKSAITLMLTSRDRFVAIQGIAGVGKTTALKKVDELCRKAGCQPLVLAENASAKNQAKTVSGMESMTTAKFLTQVESLLLTEPERAKQEFGGDRLIILDEASLVSTKNWFRLEKVIEELGTRLNYIGDFKQSGSIGSGMAFHDSLAYGIDKAVMKENMRLSDITAFILKLAK